MKKKILHLTLKKKWFDLIASGKKKEEYRDFKQYWKRRLLHKMYDEVQFRNGYRKNSPLMRVEIRGVSIADVHFEDKIKKIFIIKLGKVLKIKR